MAFVFDNSPALNTLSTITRNGITESRYSLKGNAYLVFPPWLDFGGSIDPLAEYIKKNMTMVSSIGKQDRTLACFVDKKRLAEKSFHQAITEFPKEN